MTDFAARLDGDVSRKAEYSFIKPLITDDTPTVVVDVGAWGKKNSNSWNLIAGGWRGVLIEPRPGACQKIVDSFVGDFAIEQVAIADFESESETLHRFPTRGWSSLDPDHAVKRGKGPNWRLDPIEVQVEMLPAVLERNEVPHRFGVLSVDAEGFDEKVVRPMFDSPWRPDLLIIECAPDQLLQENGYRLLQRQKDQSVWIREETTN